MTWKRDSVPALVSVCNGIQPGGPVLLCGSGCSIAAQACASCFHPTQQGLTCWTIRAYAKDAIEGKFGYLLKAGVIEWRPVDVEQRPNNHFVRDYQLVTSSLALVKFNNGRKGKWQTLDKTWALVRKKADLIQYVQANVEKFLEK